MRSDVWPVKVFDSVSDRTPAFFFALVLLAFLGPTALARDKPENAPDTDGNACKQCLDEAHVAPAESPLKAFKSPSRMAVEDAVSHIYLVLAIAGLGIILLILGTAYYYSQNSWRQTFTPTEVKRAPGVVPRPRQKEKVTQRWELFDE